MRAAPEREIPYLSVPKRFDIPRRGLIGDEFEDLSSIEPVQSEVTTLPRPPHRWRLYYEEVVVSAITSETGIDRHYLPARRQRPKPAANAVGSALRSHT